MHHYKIAQQAIDDAVRTASESGWQEEEVLQSMIVAAVQRHAGCAGSQSTRSVLDFELSNLSDSVDYDFVRSR